MPLIRHKSFLLTAIFALFCSAFGPSLQADLIFLRAKGKDSKPKVIRGTLFANEDDKRIIVLEDGKEILVEDQEIVALIQEKQTPRQKPDKQDQEKEEDEQEPELDIATGLSSRAKE